CLAILHYLEEIMSRNSDVKIGGLLLVAGWFDVDEPWDTAQPWLDNEDLSYGLFRKNILQKRVIVSDNDPFTSDYEANAVLWKDRLGAEVTLCPGKSHFNSSVEPDVMAEFRKMIHESPTV
ncbi:MAG: alpha/beta hydrolase, partial [Bacteroidetes bacterium]|nr:alpha/beta hydrolase [Bacteroidota bacterium]